MKHPMVVFSLIMLFVCTGGMVGIELGLTIGGTDWWGIFGFLVGMVICTIISFPIIIRITDGPLELDWDKLPKLLPAMVRSKEYTREEAIKLYDLFFYHVNPRIRAWDLRTFAPLPPKEEHWFLES